MGKRIVFLDYLKAIAIFLVIIYHCKAYDRLFIPPLLSMCVAIFFVVNGYLMLVKRRPYQYLLQKNIKIIFLVFFWGVLRSAFQTYVLGGDMTFSAIWAKFFALESGYGNYLWFLVALFILNLINPLIYTFVHHSPKKEILIFCVLLFIFVANFINVLSWKFNPLANWYHSEAVFYYVLGYLVIAYAGKIKYPWWKCGLVFVAFYLMQLFLGFLLEMPAFSRFWNADVVFVNYSSMWVMGETLALVVVFSKINLKENKFIAYIGRNTLGIYLIQDFFCSVTRNLMPKDYTFAYPILVLLLSVACVWLFDKTRVLKWFVKL